VLIDEIEGAGGILPMKYRDEFRYSTDELSWTFHQAAKEELVAFAEATRFHRDGTTGLWHLTVDNIQARARRFWGIEDEDNRYALPDYLTDCSAPWARALVGMYGEKSTYPAALSPDQGAFLKNLVLNINPCTVVEIGCYTGGSTVWIASGLEQLGGEGTIHSVDLFNEIFPFPPFHYEYLPDSLAAARELVASAQLAERVQFYKMDSKRMGMQVGKRLRAPIDLLFIDGDHSIQGCLADFLLFYPHVATGGYVVMHDIYPKYSGHEGPRYVINHCVRNSLSTEILEVKTYPENRGMAVIRKRGADPKLHLAGALLRTAITGWPVVKRLPIGGTVARSVLKRAIGVGRSQ